ncbi:MAG TPA: DUF4149 domain-containing protein [Telluria sp.]
MAVSWLSVLGAAAVFSWIFFATLPRPVAGDAVSLMLKASTWLGVGYAAVLLMTRPSRAVCWLAIGMLACSLTIYFGLQPMMAALRAAAAAGTLTADLKTQFGLLHLGSVGFYAAEVVLGILLIRRLDKSQR